MGVLGGPLSVFGHGVHLMPPCFDLLRMRGIINEKSKKFIKISIISYTKMISQVFLVKSEKKNVEQCYSNYPGQGRVVSGEVLESCY